MRVFGYILPMIVIDKVRCMADGGPVDHPQHEGGYRTHILAAGWLGWGFSIRVGRVRHATREEIMAFRAIVRTGLSGADA